MDDDTRFVIEFLAAQAVFVSALIHLTAGVMNWLRWWQGGGYLVPQDLRWPLSVVSGIAIIAGLYVGSHREYRRPFYAAGIVAMAGYVLAYFGWHLGGHRLGLVVGPAAGGSEAVSLQWFLDHLLAGPVEFISVAVEILAVMLLAVLLLADHEREAGGEHQ
jgi:hypothetical protein